MHIIQNTAGITCLNFWLDKDDELQVDRYAVLAWLVGEGMGGAIAILCETLEDEALCCYEQRLANETSYIFPGRVCKTLDEARMFARCKLVREKEEDFLTCTHCGKQFPKNTPGSFSPTPVPGVSYCSYKCGSEQGWYETPWGFELDIPCVVTLTPPTKETVH